MDTLIKHALIGNAASMGYNWVYDPTFIQKRKALGDILFQAPDSRLYAQSKKAFFAYPNATAGDVSAQGEALKWLYEALSKDPDFSRESYLDMMYRAFKPGGKYKGWAESYVKGLVFNRLAKELKQPIEPLDINDKQLVAFAPYFACKALGLSRDKAWDLAQAFTKDTDYLAWYDVFDALFEALETGTPLKDALNGVILKAPKTSQAILQEALKQPDALAFGTTVVNTACGVDHAVPLAFNIMAHAQNFEEALTINTLLGGASSDRGTLIGAILGFVFDVPETFESQTNFEAV